MVISSVPGPEEIVIGPVGVEVKFAADPSLAIMEMTCGVGGVAPCS
jgi:hypothetical protein